LNPFQVEFQFERKETEADRNNTNDDEDPSTLSSTLIPSFCFFLLEFHHVYHFTELRSKISSLFSSSKDELDNSTNTTSEETIPTVRETLIFRRY
jgi:hypothetical protein